MKRIFYTAAALLCMLNARSQTIIDTGFKSRRLKIEEIDLVSSYYHQNGNNSAVTGGLGSEKLTDLANVISVKLVKYDKRNRKNNFDIDLGIDHYTSASSDLVDLKANTSASHADTRLYPSLGWTRENEKNGTTVGIGLSSSTEFDYQSFGGNLSLSVKTKNRNGEFTAKFQAYLDQVKLVDPIELRTNVIPGRDHYDYGSSSRNTFAGSLSYSQIINERLQVMFLVDGVQQQGYLSLPFHRVYFSDGSVHQENLPANRFKLPLGFRANYFFGDKVIIKAYYRYYTDDWGLRSNTANIELPVKITPFVSVSPFYRYYNQTAAKYFNAYEKHTAQNEYYTSNYDLSKFNSSFFGTGIRIAPPKGILGAKNFSMIEVRYGHYTKNIGMNSDIISMNLKFK